MGDIKRNGKNVPDAPKINEKPNVEQHTKVKSIQLDKPKPTEELLKVIPGNTDVIMIKQLEAINKNLQTLVALFAEMKKGK